jgi:hypothetical protein
LQRRYSVTIRIVAGGEGTLVAEKFDHKWGLAICLVASALVSA